MINKELFVETINFMRDRNDATLKLNELIREEFIDSTIYPYCSYDTQLIKVLSNSFDYDDAFIKEWIEYFCYDRNFGREDLGLIIIRDDKGVVKKSYCLDTPENLYDFLFEESCSIAKL